MLRRLFSSLPSHQVVGLPALSPTMQKGTLGIWKVKEGERIQPGTVLLDIVTDKASIDFEATDDGFLAKILKPSGSEDVPVGSPIAILVEEQKDVLAFADYKVETTKSPATKPSVGVVEMATPPPPPPAVVAPPPPPPRPAVVVATPAAKTAPVVVPAASKPSKSLLSPLLLAECLAYEAKFGSTRLVPPLL